MSGKSTQAADLICDMLQASITSSCQQLTKDEGMNEVRSLLQPGSIRCVWCGLEFHLQPFLVVQCKRRPVQQSSSIPQHCCRQRSNDSVQRLTFLVLKFILMSSFMFSVTGLYSAIQLFFRGVIRCWGTVTCISKVLNTPVESPSLTLTGRQRPLQRSSWAAHPSELNLLAVLLIGTQRLKVRL